MKREEAKADRNVPAGHSGPAWGEVEVSKLHLITAHGAPVATALVSSVDK